MQFIPHGPEIPDGLLQAHEEGRVVFFCGAGISYPAGLPLFQGLVDQVYTDNNETRTPIEDDAYKREQYDATLHLLEQRLRNRMAIRKPLLRILTPKSLGKRATKTHRALLQLSRGKNGAVRLVTTNFDRVFQHAIKATKEVVPCFAAPMLPIPKDCRWNGLVYLHGLLPDQADEEALNRLVLTSGDFGLAYLTERWASRFVTELFRGYVVCFVGYSINDPVLRYMMDALAADRGLGESTPQAYAFGDYETGEEDRQRGAWEAKGVVPILYHVPKGTHDHSNLHKTLVAWANTYRDGVLGLEKIVAQSATGLPQASTKQDNFVGRTMWALSDPTGLPAKKFAEFNPVPSLDWLDPFTEARYHHEDLVRFRIPPRPDRDASLAFSLFQRPAPYTHAPWMAMTVRPTPGSGWDDVMFQMARWLVRHLDDSKLILWLIKQGGQLHPQLHWRVAQRLEEIERLSSTGQEDELARTLENAPASIPRPVLRTVWRFLLAGRVKSPWHDLDLYRWKEAFKRDGLTPLVRMQFCEALRPLVELKEPFHWPGREAERKSRPERLTDLVGVEVVLASDYASSALKDLRQTPEFRSQLPALLPDIQSLLLETLDLLRELGAANDLSDNSHWDHPSISPHRQNQGFKEWVVLIDLVREAWSETVALDPPKARRIAESWWETPYPTFKRLALFAAANTDLLPAKSWVDWLLAQDGWWLWSIETKRETMRLLVLKGTSMSRSERAQLENGILCGPPRRMYRKGLKAKDWKELVDHAVWLRLAKMESAGLRLGKAAKAMLTRISLANPVWSLADNQSDEFSHWMSGTGDPDFESKRKCEHAPRNRHELVDWLQRPIPSDRFLYQDDWREVCRDRFSLAVTALLALSKLGVWPVNRWTDALLNWGNDQFGYRSWRYLARAVKGMPREGLTQMAHAIAWWIEFATKGNRIHHDIFMELADLFLAIDYPNTEDAEMPVSAAINHPVGMVTVALVQDWFVDRLEDGQGLRPDLKSIFSRLSDRSIPHFRHARVILCRNLVSLFRVDPEWTKEHLLPAFQWEMPPSEAMAAWEGFLWAPRLYWPLVDVLRSPLLETAKHYPELKEHGRQYVSFMTYAALEPGCVLSPTELRQAFLSLPDDSIGECIQAMIHTLEAAGEKQKECWENRILPFWRTIWPKARAISFKGSVEKLGVLAIAAGGAFPSAIEALRDYLLPGDHCHWILSKLNESRLGSLFPMESLELLDRSISEKPGWISKDLQACLDAIQASLPKASRDRRFQRLKALARRFE